MGLPGLAIVILIVIALKILFDVRAHLKQRSPPKDASVEC